MKSISEAILSKKNISDIVNIDQELFKKSFSSIYSNSQNYEYVTNPKKYDYAIIRLGSLINNSKNPRDIEINSYLLNTQEWESNHLNKEMAFTSYTGDKRLETKYPITIVFEGDYIEGFTFIGTNISFVIGSHQRVKDCDFSKVGEARFFFYDESNKESVMRAPTYNTVYNKGSFIATWMKGNDLVKERTSELRKIFDVRSIILPNKKKFYLGTERDGRPDYQSIYPDEQVVMDALNCDRFDIDFKYIYK